MPIRSSTTAGRAIQLIVALGAGVGAVFATADATGWEVAGAAWRFALAVVVTLAAMRARRWTVVLPAGAATALADEVALVVLGAVALVLLFALAVMRRHSPPVQGLAAALAINVLLRLPDVGPLGVSATIVALAVAPVLWSGYTFARRRERRWARRGLAALAIGTVAAAAGLALAAGMARSAVAQGVDQAQSGLDAARNGRPEEAELRFVEASRRFADANRTLRSPLALPARLLPVLGPNAKALERATAMGSDLGQAGGTVASSIDSDELRMRQGRLDLDAVGRLRQPVDAATSELRAATGTLSDLRSPWLVEPLVDRLGELRDQVRSGRHDAESASAALAVAPDLLGASGPRRYFVAFISPAEQRDLGGFMGSFAILEATDGDLELTTSGAAADLNRITDLTLADPSAYPPRLVATRPERFWQNVTATADFPTAARLMGELWQQATGQKVDGAIALDPKALAGLLEITGPVTVEGIPEPLTAENAEQYLLVDQYVQFPSDREERQGLLADALRATFEKLTNSDLPSPRAAVDALIPAAEGRRLVLWSGTPAEEDFFRTIEVDGAAPEPSASRSVLSVRTVNAGANKIDAYLQRSTQADVHIDPESGLTRTTLEVTLDNQAPATGLPGAVIGNIKGYPTGTNVLDLVVSYGHELVEATVDGRPVPVAVVEEYGSNVVVVRLAIPPGARQRAELVFDGPTTMRQGRWRLDVVPQPSVLDDIWQVEVSAPGGYDLKPLRGTTTGAFENDRVHEIGVQITSNRP